MNFCPKENKLKTIFKFFAERHLLATLMTLMILFLGVNGLLNIKRDLFPKVSLNQVYISTFYPGAAPEDVELAVTNKIETHIKSISGIKDYTSYSLEHMSLIVVEINIDLSEKRVNNAVQEIRNAVARISDFPPEVVEASTVTRIRTSEIPILEIGIASDSLKYSDLRKQAQILYKKIKGLNGIVKIEKNGYRAREVHIELNPATLKEKHISMSDIRYAIQARNVRGSGGTFESFVAEQDIMTLAQFKKPQEVGDVIIRTTFEGPVIRLKDLAVIKDDFEEEKTQARLNGKSAISLTVYKTENSDIMRTVDRIKTFLKGEEKNIQDGVEILYSNDMSRYVDASYDVVKKNALTGILLVLAMLAIFLNFRTAFWVAIGIPVSLLGAVALLPLFDVALDVITLSAMILVLGILVDDAIIIAENINRHRELGKKPVEAAVDGLSEVAGPVLVTVLTTLIAFSPMFFIPGAEGKFIVVIPLVISLTLVISLIEGLFALPAHVISGKLKKAKSGRNWFDYIRLGYERFMKYVLKLRYALVLLFSGALLFSLYYAVTEMNIKLFPSEGAEEFAIYCDLPVGTTLQATSYKMKEVEALLDTLPDEELQSYTTHIGSQDDGTFRKNVGVVNVVLTPFSTRSRTADEIADELRPQLDSLKDFTQVSIDIEESGPAAKQPIVLHLVGSDDELREKLAKEIMAFMEEEGSFKDVYRSDKAGKSQIEIKLNFEKLARRGLTVADVAENVRIAFDGETVTKVRYGEDDVKFRLMLNKKVRHSYGYLNNLNIPNSEGRLIPLKEVAKLVESPGALDYTHFNGERVVTITADLKAKTTAKRATAIIKNEFPIEKKYPGMKLTSMGEAERTETTFGNIERTFLIAIIGIYFLLMILFNSVTQPLLIMIAIPFGLPGIILVFGLHGEAISFMGMLGIIGFSGVVVNDSLVLVDHLNKLIKKFPDTPLKELVARGTADRLRAILLTTITTAAGLLPLAYGIGGADPYNAPMALALGWGLVTATPLILMLVPSLFLIGSDFSGLLRKVFKTKN